VADSDVSTSLNASGSWTAASPVLNYLGFALSQHVQLADKPSFKPCQALVTDMTSITNNLHSSLMLEMYNA